MININGKDYELKYTVNVLSKMSGAGLDVMGDGLDKINGSIFCARKAFYYGLIEENGKMTEARAGQLMDKFIEEGNSIADLIEKVINAILDGLGLNSDEENADDETMEVIDEGK